MLLAGLREKPLAAEVTGYQKAAPPEAGAGRGMTWSRLAADLWLLKGLDRKASWGNTCVATNLTIRRINRRDSAVVGAALGAAMQRTLAHYFTWLNGYKP